MRDINREVLACETITEKFISVVFIKLPHLTSRLFLSIIQVMTKNFPNKIYLLYGTESPLKL